MTVTRRRAIRRARRFADAWLVSGKEPPGAQHVGERRPRDSVVETQAHNRQPTIDARFASTRRIALTPPLVRRRRGQHAPPLSLMIARGASVLRVVSRAVAVDRRDPADPR
jgi:hypothetical protein